MPFTYVFRNSAHYWLLGGLCLATSLYGPWHGNLGLRHTTRDDPFFLNTCVVIWVVLEVMNFSAHWTLMNLRPKGTRRRGIPRGPLFAKVSCPNYTTEIAGWSVVWFMTGDFWCTSVSLVTFHPPSLPNQLSKSYSLPSSLAPIDESILILRSSGGVFTIVGATIMAKWAIGKHHKYRGDFGDKYPRGRKAIFPWIL